MRAILPALLACACLSASWGTAAAAAVGAGNVKKYSARLTKPPPSKNNQIPTAAAVSSSKRSSSSSAAWLNGLKSGLASAMSAACVKTALQPIDAVKTMQQYARQQNTLDRKSLSIWAACQKIMSGPGGFWNFYAGLGVTVIGAMPGVALYFGVYSYCRQSLGKTSFGRHYRMANVMVSAALGNTVASFSRVPYEVLKQKLQTGAYTSTWAALKGAAQEPGGIRGLLFPPGGVAIQMIRDVPYAMCTLLLYESLQAAYIKRQEQQQQQRRGSSTTSKQTLPTAANNRIRDFIVGGAAGGIGSYVTNPMDVVKTRLQTDSALYQGSVVQCARSIWDEGGAAAFLRGSVPRLMHKVPANAFFFLFYEIFRKLLRVNDDVVA